MTGGRRLMAALVAIFLLTTTVVAAGYVIGIEPGLPDGESSNPSSAQPAVESFDWTVEPCNPGAGYVRITEQQGPGRPLLVNVSFRVESAPESFSPELHRRNGQFVLELNPSGAATSDCRYVSLESTVRLPDESDELVVEYGNETVMEVAAHGASASSENE